MISPIKFPRNVLHDANNRTVIRFVLINPHLVHLQEISIQVPGAGDAQIQRFPRIEIPGTTGNQLYFERGKNNNFPFEDSNPFP